MTELNGKKVTLDAATGRVWVDVDVPVVGGESNDTLMNIVGLLTCAEYGPKVEKTHLKYKPGTVSPGLWHLTYAEFVALSADELFAIQKMMQKFPESRLVVDFRPERLEEDAKLDALWQKPTSAFKAPDLFKLKALPASVRNRLVFVGSEELQSIAEKEHIGFLTYPKNLEESLDRKTTYLSASAIKALGGEVVASKLKEALQNAGFADRPLIELAPWQYVVPQVLKGIEA
jgi:hypothetical protein